MLFRGHRRGEKILRGFAAENGIDHVLRRPIVVGSSGKREGQPASAASLFDGTGGVFVGKSGVQVGIGYTGMAGNAVGMPIGQRLGRRRR